MTARLVAAALDGYDPDEARARGGRALFDHLACLTAGRRAAPAGLGDAGAAVLHDRDDVHWPSMTHPGAVVWTVVRATGADGEARWRAAHAGYEVTCRLGRALGPEHRRFWHASTTAGTVGGAVAGAIALDTDPVAAAAHAIAITGGSILPVLQRSPTRLLQRDHAAASALRCAELADVLPPTGEGLEHDRGLFAAMGGSMQQLLEPVERPALAEVRFRRHATSGFAQAAVEAAAELAPVDADASVVAQVPEAALALAGIPAPRDPQEAWWSCRHAIAVTLLGLDLEDGSLVDDRRVAALRDRVRLEAGPRSRVTVGDRSAERDLPAPLTDDDLLRKWHTLNPDDAPPRELLA
jgi:2-methylcitrate dehydratase PrpD